MDGFYRQMKKRFQEGGNNDAILKSEIENSQIQSQGSIDQRFPYVHNPTSSSERFARMINISKQGDAASDSLTNVNIGRANQITNPALKEEMLNRINSREFPNYDSPNVNPPLPNKHTVEFDDGSTDLNTVKYRDYLQKGGPKRKTITAEAFAAKQAAKKPPWWVKSAKQKAEFAKKRANYKKENPLSKELKATIGKNKAKAELDKRKWDSYLKSVSSKTDMSGRIRKPIVEPKIKRVRKPVDPAKQAYLDAGLNPNYVSGYHKKGTFKKQYGGATGPNGIL